MIIFFLAKLLECWLPQPCSLSFWSFSTCIVLYLKAVKRKKKIPSNWPASFLILRIPVSAYAHYIIDNIIRMAYTILHTYILRSVWHQMDSASIFTCEKVFWIALTYNEEKIHIRIYSIGTVPPKWNNIYKTKLKG